MMEWIQMQDMAAAKVNLSPIIAAAFGSYVFKGPMIWWIAKTEGFEIWSSLAGLHAAAALKTLPKIVFILSGP